MYPICIYSSIIIVMSNYIVRQHFQRLYIIQSENNIIDTGVMDIGFAKLQPVKEK